MLLVGELFGGDHDVGGHDIGAGHADHGGGPSIFSVRIMAAFLTAFGVGGVVGRYYELSHPAASGIGVVAGIVMAERRLSVREAALLAAGVERAAMTGSSAGPPRSRSPFPRTASARSSSSRGERTEHIARSAGGAAIARGPR